MIVGRSAISLLFLILVTVNSYCQSPPVENKVLPQICISETEREIFSQVNECRRQKGLSPVALSLSLTYVAQLHVWDLAENDPVSRRCNLHSWSHKGPWSPCCYTEDEEEAGCMWNKPRELTNYPGEGYEIAYWTDEPLDPGPFAEKAVRAWKRSPAHNRVIVNSGEWRKLDWNAMGVGYYRGYAVVWFGEVTDNQEGAIHLCDN
jgi:uncharacterized protein YkwD